MNYIIDANNLAGCMGILFTENFDKELIDIFVLYNEGKGKKIFLVFDSIDRMGDKRSEDNNIEVIYAPRDEHYKSADDKIVEMVDLDMCGNEVMVVSDDIDLKERIGKIAREQDKKVVLKKATDFALELQNRNIADEDEKEISEDDVGKINKELMDLWVK